MRRLLILIALVVILALLTLFTRSVASWQHYVLSGDSGMLLYAATFDGSIGVNRDGFNDDWTQYPGRLSAEISGGQMQITVGAENTGSYSVAAPYFGDFDLSADAQTLAGPVDNGYGVVFRLQNKDNTNLQDDNYYLFLISGDGYYQVSRAVNGVVKVISDWIASPQVKQGLNVVNHLRVVARGAQFRFYVNDQPMQLCIPTDPAAQSTINPLTGDCMGGAMQDMLTDSTIPNGQIGVSAQSTATGGADVVAGFDNLLIYAPAAS